MGPFQLEFHFHGRAKSYHFEVGINEYMNSGQRGFGYHPWVWIASLKRDHVGPFRLWIKNIILNWEKKLHPVRSKYVAAQHAIIGLWPSNFFLCHLYICHISISIDQSSAVKFHKIRILLFSDYHTVKLNLKKTKYLVLYFCTDSAWVKVLLANWYLEPVVDRRPWLKNVTSSLHT